jgi:uncharacterized protein
MASYIRKKHYSRLWKSINDEINLIQVVIGPRQVGKTTLALQIFRKWRGLKLYESADQPDIPTIHWIKEHWEKIRGQQKTKRTKALLILDEIQKIPRWSEMVKRLVDEDRRFGRNIRVVLLGSSALLMQKGLTESLAGRFEIHRHFQWSFKECRECFKINLNQYLFYGGYPKALTMRKDHLRWSQYMRDSLIETVLSKDILLMSPVTKPALLRQTFGLSMDYPAQIVSYQKMLGSLQDAGNTTTIASYLQLLSKAFLVAPIERWRGSKINQRASTPKLVILDNGLLFSMNGFKYKEAIGHKTLWGRCVENSVGARLYYVAQEIGASLFYWRDRDKEVDFVLKYANRVIGIEVKSGLPQKTPAAFRAFRKKYRNAECIMLSSQKNSKAGTDISRISLKDFFQLPTNQLFG